LCEEAAVRVDPDAFGRAGSQVRDHFRELDQAEITGVVAKESGEGAICLDVKSASDSSTHSTKLHEGQRAEHHTFGASHLAPRADSPSDA
jgi:hypothetical protein